MKQGFGDILFDKTDPVDKYPAVLSLVNSLSSWQENFSRAFI
jgi:hypothetical protein